MLSEARSEKITNTGLTVITMEGSRKTIEADTVLIAVPPKANSALLETLEGAVPEIYPIGDCKEPRLILDAIADGSHIGRRI
jgi:pyruvate/2-oxoglutarate dehydrogenase complex dihydrolipoamide dehydrogenase (E3) component